MIKIVAGGHLGVERAVLDFAVKHKIAYEGWAAKDDLAGDVKLVKKYADLDESKSRSYTNRDYLNVVAATGVLLICPDEILEQGGKPLLIIDFATRLEVPLHISNGEDIPEIVKWASFLTQPTSLNITGPDEKLWPEAYAKTEKFLIELWKTL